ncbi:MAG: valine--tRNA ligase [Candidatus Marsarchaeota archaeon]|nr:valine--tRNA ligase [Candidatus Marsarchaeota archaeon]
MKDFNAKKVQEKWSKLWVENNTYSFKNDGKPVFSIDSPPPFTSGDLHFGHVLSYSLFDFAARFKRMNGFDVFFPQGWDCQGFPTELTVEKKFGRLPKKEFKEKCVQTTLENIKRMKSQMQFMGFSSDPALEYKTIDDDYHRKVQLSVLKMFDLGLVYKAEHPVLFCTNCKSAIAKAETEVVERKSKLFYLKFNVEGEVLLVATSRPELLHACVAVFVNPADDRYKKFVSKKALTPFGVEVPVIADVDADSAFGSGAVMVCTFGDESDVAWVYRHKLPVINALTEKGFLSNAGKYDGLNITQAREKVIEDLTEKGLVERVEEITQNVKVHDRCGRVVELISTLQWFIKIKEFKKQVEGWAREIRWYPEFTLQYLLDWNNFVDYDWVISRQRVYGTPIPFWVCEKCGVLKPAKEEDLPVDENSKPPGKCECGGDFKLEDSVLDVWVDSSVSALIISGWPDNKKLFEKVYPCTLRPQGTEIIRTWGFYSILRCGVLTGKTPFSDIIINGTVLGSDGKKMSKSTKNYEDPEKVFSIYSSDAIRQWAALSGILAKDRPFNYKDIDYGESFLKKLWNAFKFVESAEKKAKESDDYSLTDRWVLSRLNRLVKKTTVDFNNYDFYSAITGVQSFFWHEFCDLYLEDVKWRVYSGSGGAAVKTLKTVLLTSLKLLAPFIPYTAEEVYSNFETYSIHLSEWPVSREEFINDEVENIVNVFHEIVSRVRKFKSEKSLPLGGEIQFAEITVSEELLKPLSEVSDDLKGVCRVKVLSLKGGKELKVDCQA